MRGSFGVSSIIPEKVRNMEKPFSKSFVMRTTFRHMRRSVDISIRKSFERFQDFDNDSKTGQEIMETLSVLHTVRKMMDDFQEENSSLFIDTNKLD
jgi:hypothetical protein